MVHARMHGAGSRAPPLTARPAVPPPAATRVPAAQQLEGQQLVFDTICRCFSALLDGSGAPLPLLRGMRDLLRLLPSESKVRPRLCVAAWLHALHAGDAAAAAPAAVWHARAFFG